MIQKGSSFDHAGGFRRKAEEIIRGKAAARPKISETISPDDMLRLLHEMQVQQVELEIQNEELRLAREDADRMRKQAADLYEFIPVGCIALDHKGRIVNANLSTTTLLGVDRSALIMEPLGRYIAPEFQDSYHLKKQAALDDIGPHVCELQMIKGDGSLLWVRLDCRTGVDSEGNKIFRCVLSDISDQWRSYEALSESVDFTKSIIQSMDSGFSVLGPDGVATDVNPALCEMTGFSERELIGCAAPYPYWPPEEYPTIQAALEHTMKSEGADFELIFMRRDGERFPVSISAFAIKDRNGKVTGFAVIVVDITERKRDEHILREWNQNLERRVAERTAALYESEARFRLLVDASNEGIVISKDGIVLDGNPQLGRIYRCDTAKMIGRPVSEWIAPESRALVAERIASGDEATYEFFGLLEDGTKISLEAHGRTMTWQGVEKRVTTIRDLTAEKEVEAKLETQKLELDQALRLAILSEVCAGIVHQIGQPLCAVGANVAAANARLEASDAQACESMELIRAIEGDVKRMRDLVNHLRALANPGCPERKPLDFNAMVSDGLAAVRSDARRQRLEIRLNLATGLPPVQGDAVQLSQVVINLLRNALEASAECPEERRVVEIATREFPDSGVELTVCDEGIGMNPGDLTQLFTPFFSTKSDGMGIGLRLCLTIVEAHGGSIEGFNNLKRPGMTFRVLLPLESHSAYTKV
jgi:PAS domain S-box-containing protein